jgi:hypothetical protein
VSANILKNVCENMLTHVHKVKHLVVSTFEQGWRSWRRGGTVFHWPDSGHGATKLGTSASGQQHRGAQLGLHDQMMNNETNRTRRACVRSGGDVRWHELLYKPEWIELRAASLLISGSDRGDCEGFLIFPCGEPKGTLVDCSWLVWSPSCVGCAALDCRLGMW